MGNLPGYAESSVKTAMWYDSPHPIDDTSTTLPKTEVNAKPYLRSHLVVLTKSEEDWVYYLKSLGYRRPIIQYVLFTEVSYFTTNSSGTKTQDTPTKNCWAFSSTPWRTALEYDPTAWLHLASTTSTGAVGGATSVPVADLTKFQQISAGGIGVVDVYASNGTTFLGLFHYTAISGTSGSGTLTVPGSGYGSINADPTATTGVGATNPQTGSGWSLTRLTSIPSGAVLRCRVRSGQTSGNHTFLADPTSTNFRTWASASYAAYLATTPTGTSPTNLWDGIFLDNMHTGTDKFSSWTPSNVLPTPIGGSTWTASQWDDADISFATYVKQNIVTQSNRGQLWGNAWPQNYTTDSTHNTERDRALRFRNEAGVDGMMFEDLAASYVTTVHSVAVMDRKFDLVDQVLAAGSGIIAVGQSLDVTNGWANTARANWVIAFLLLCYSDQPDVMGRFTYSGGSNQVKAYFTWWAYWYYHAKLGRPTGDRVKTGTTSVTYSRTFERGSVSLFTDGSTNTATITLNNP